jgi:hypothetical protein
VVLLEVHNISSFAFLGMQQAAALATNWIQVKQSRTGSGGQTMTSRSSTGKCFEEKPL